MFLVCAIREDRESGARFLIEEFGTRLFATAYRLCLNDADAEDLASRTFARAVERIDDFDGKSSLFTWLCAIMMNFRRMDMRRKGANALGFTDAVPEREDPHPDPGGGAILRGRGGCDPQDGGILAGFPARTDGAALFRRFRCARDRPHDVRAGRDGLLSAASSPRNAAGETFAKVSR